MSWKIALVVALLTALVTAFVTAFVADKVTGLHGVSDFEGKRGYAVVFLFIPAGFLGGFMLGLLGTKLVGATDWAQFWKAAGLSVLLGQVALFGIAGLSLLSIPRPLKHQGGLLALEVEVRVPLERITERSREPDQIRMSLYAGPKDNGYAIIDRSKFREEEGFMFVLARADLNTRSSARVLSFHIEEDTWLAFDLPLPETPEPGDWSDPSPMRDARTAGNATVWSDVQLRYRVVLAEAGQPAQ
ncbi:MAG: hypothetical protein IPK70_11635 [Flavobacteriales bacterium]|nr:hypothetical protein [Flavobacteriales bacterium]